MKLIARGGTDGANIVLFWPDNLPDDADAMRESDPICLVESLRDQGKLIWFPCEGDGDYTVAVFVQADLPDDLIRYYTEEERIPALAVRGVGYFGGMEYVFKKDSWLLDKYPRMCERIQIPEGTYSARVYRSDVPEELSESWLESRVGARAMRLWDMHGNIAAGAVIGVLASFGTFFCLPWAVWFCVLAIALPLLFAAVAMSRTDWYKSVRKAQDDFEMAYPAYVVHLQ